MRSAQDLRHRVTRGLAPAIVAFAFALPALAAPVPLANPGFESKEPGEGGFPRGWAAFQHAGEESYDFVLDSGQKKSGEQSLRIRNIGREPYGTIAQVLPAGPFTGRTVRLSAWMRTEGIPERRGRGAGLVLLALRGSTYLAHEAMKTSRVHGTTDWKLYTIELALPPAATRLEIGATLEGGGTLWVDDFELEVVER